MPGKHHNQERKQHHSDHVRTKSHLTVRSMLSPIATRLRTRLRYSELIVGSALPIIETLFNLNSLFDPNYTGTGHQPLGFDQIKTLYQRYRVYKTRYHVSFVTVGNVAARCTVVPTNSTTTIANMDVAAETLYAKTTKTMLVAYQPVAVTGVVNLAQLNGRTPQQYADDDTTGALISASPTENLMLHVLFGTNDGSNFANTTTAQVILEFDCEFYDPVQLSAS